MFSNTSYDEMVIAFVVVLLAQTILFFKALRLALLVSYGVFRSKKHKLTNIDRTSRLSHSTYKYKLYQKYNNIKQAIGTTVVIQLIKVKFISTIETTILKMKGSNVQQISTSKALRFT